MSKLKDQLKVILPTLSEEANRNQDKEVKFRLYALKAIVESKKDVKKACEARGVSTDFFMIGVAGFCGCESWRA